MPDKLISELTEDDYYHMHLALENMLVEMRNNGLSCPIGANGFVIRYENGEPSSLVRLGTKEGIKMAINFLLNSE
jgi:hypothetical protein